MWGCWIRPRIGQALFSTGTRPMSTWIGRQRPCSIRLSATTLWLTATSAWAGLPWSSSMASTTSTSMRLMTQRTNWSCPWREGSCRSTRLPQVLPAGIEQSDEGTLRRHAICGMSGRATAPEGHRLPQTAPVAPRARPESALSAPWRDRRNLFLHQKNQGLRQYAVVLHGVGHLLVLHSGHDHVQVSDIHQYRDLCAVLGVDERPDIRDSERAEDLFSLRRGKPVVCVLHIVVPDDGRHAASLGGVHASAQTSCSAYCDVGRSRDRSSADR